MEKIFFHVVFQRKKDSPPIWYFQGEFHKVYFWQAFSEDRRLQKQGVIRVKLRKNVGFPAWTRLVKHRLFLQHSACMLLTVCSLGHTSKCLTKVFGCRIVWGQFCERIFDDGISWEHPLIGSIMSLHKEFFDLNTKTFRGETMIIISIIFVIMAESQRPFRRLLFVANWLIMTSRLKAFPKDQ